MRIDDLTYDLPHSSIAQVPIEPRHDARLLDTRDGLTDRTFVDLPDLLFPGDVLVVNSTKVRAARLAGRRADTGGSVEVLVLDQIEDGRWEALVRPARRIRPGVAIVVSDVMLTVETEPAAGRVIVRADGDLEAVMATDGEVPLPPYITEHLSDPDRYQTMFADVAGSAAAPTAGLHFTQYVYERLAVEAIRVVPVDLHVGLGTFRPITTDRVEDHVMHAEWFSVPPETVEVIADAKRAGGRVIAVGTTVVRTLESAALEGELRPAEGSTRLFITDGFPFRVVDDLITNFHVPGSTLLAMLNAFMGPRWRTAYEHAVSSGYRMLSFGDAMLASRAGR